ncbi:sporulation protein YqfD [Tepidibacillus sp. LV47]|uniref:sporulation protein YqfD n=1 Tax=Tepidibacillus sp. LV47 TaxID=3398228 RepID=UPI003AAEE001
MNVRGIKWIKGYIRCTIRGKYIELFINMAVKEKLEFWNFRLLENGLATFSISLADFFKLKPILKKTYTRIHVYQKIGLPFILARLGKRKGIITGLIFFFIFLYLLSSMIWSIDIEGNKMMKEEEVYQALYELGIHRGMFKYQLPKYEVLQEQLEARLEQASWVGVKLKGTQLTITIAEKVKPPKTTLIGPRHVISSKNAVIAKILAKKGVPLVEVNDRVKKGDILISGILGKEENQQLVAATGEVRGIVWYQSNVIIPLKQQWKEYTGQYMEREYLSFGKRMIRLKGNKEIPYQHYQSIYKQKVLQFKNYKIPITLVKEKVLEYNEKERIISVNEAVQLGIEQAKKDLLRKIATGSIIKSEKVLHQNQDRGKVNLQVLFEVDEDITTTIPIVQGE